jgi:predicted DNA-binding transcriptional regulator AlpA
MKPNVKDRAERSAEATIPRLGRAREICVILGIARSTLHVWLKDPEKNFPAPLRLGPGTVVWCIDDVLAWAKSRVEG